MIPRRGNITRSLQASKTGLLHCKVFLKQTVGHRFNSVSACSAGAVKCFISTEWLCLSIKTLSSVRSVTSSADVVGGSV